MAGLITRFNEHCLQLVERIADLAGVYGLAETMASGKRDEY